MRQAGFEQGMEGLPWRRAGGPSRPFPLGPLAQGRQSWARV